MAEHIGSATNVQLELRRPVEDQGTLKWTLDALVMTHHVHAERPLTRAFTDKILTDGLWPGPEIPGCTGKLPLDEIRSRSEARRLARRHAPISSSEPMSCLASSPSPKQSNPRARHLSQRGGFDAAQKARVRLPRAAPSHKSLGSVDDGAAGNLIRRA